MQKWIVRILYGWAIIFHTLLWIHIYNQGVKSELAIVTMSFGLLVDLGCYFGLYTTHTYEVL
jgi:hypothetical protein